MIFIISIYLAVPVLKAIYDLITVLQHFQHFRYNKIRCLF